MKSSGIFLTFLATFVYARKSFKEVFIDEADFQIVEEFDSKHKLYYF